MPPKAKLAKIIQEHTFSEKYDELRGEHPRLDDVHAGIDWLLARQPRQGTSVNEDHRVYKTSRYHITPAFYVLYRYVESEHTVYLLSLKAVEDSEL